jgi:hypothetical protein
VKLLVKFSYFRFFTSESYKQDFHLTRPLQALPFLLIERVALAHSALGI